MSTISREELISLIDHRIKHTKDARKRHTSQFVDGMEDGYARIRSEVLLMPSVEPERKKDEWITFREWLKDQETFVEFEEPITKVVVRGVEFVPVVRCKECKYLLPNDRIAPNWWRICDYWRTGVDENEYCSHGERREDGRFNQQTGGD